MFDLFYLFDPANIVFYIGLFSRYLFYLIIGKRKTFNFLLGGNLNEPTDEDQLRYTMEVGMVVGFLLLVILFILIFF
jgi:hypothetical protein